MSKFIADKAYRMINENNELVVCYVVSGEHKRGAQLALEELKDIPFKIKRVYKKFKQD